MAEPASKRNLIVIDSDSGERFEEGCPECQQAADKLKGAERDINTWRVRYYDMLRDKEGDARKDPLWPDGERLFEAWKAKCRTTRSRSAFTYQRFDLVRPYLKRHGFDLCLLAIEGAAYDPFITTRKNGREKKHNGWELIFKEPAKMEDFVQRAPDEAVAVYKQAIAQPVKAETPVDNGAEIHTEQIAMLRPVDTPHPM